MLSFYLEDLFMKQMRVPLFIALGVALVGIILGSFLDLQISAAVASPTSGFGLFVSCIAPTIGFAAVAAMGGGFIAFAIKGQYPTWLKVLFYIFAAGCYGIAVYYSYGEYFGLNGFYWVAKKWMGLLIAVPIEAAAMVGGYFLFKDYQNKNSWIIFLVVAVTLAVALLGFVTVLKDIFHRPRYRLIMMGDVEFYNWWQPCKNYKDLMETYSIVKEDFKSFPSGHTSESSVIIVLIAFLPLINKKFEKLQLPLFVCGCLFVFLVGVCRILAAAHFLSDVSMGAFIMMLLTIIANEVVMRIKSLQLEETPAKE